MKTLDRLGKVCRVAMPVLLASLLACSTASNRAPVVRPGGDVYVVSRGDTLYTIAFPRGLRYQDLARWNGIAAPYVIYPGQRLRLSGTASASSRDRASGRVAQSSGSGTSVPHSKPAAKAPATVTVVSRPPSVVGSAPVRRSPTTTKPSQIKVSTRPDRVIASPARVSSGLSWIWPVNGKLLKGFSASSEGKKGIDIGGKAGQAVVAAANGTIVYAGSGLRGYGKLIIIEHNKKYLSAYAHNRALRVHEGERVAQGQSIAEMGQTGTSRVMLHFEIRRDGQAVDPIRYLP